MEKSHPPSLQTVNFVSYNDDRLGKICDGYNSGMIIMGTANCFVIGFKTSSRGGNACLVL